jgi:hypothetical protein
VAERRGGGGVSEVAEQQYNIAVRVVKYGSEVVNTQRDSEAVSGSRKVDSDNGLPLCGIFLNSRTSALKCSGGVD